MKKMLILTLTIGIGLSLQAQTSEENPRLKKALKRFPAADANKDGVLTPAEAKAFMKEKRGQNARPEVTVAQAPEGGERHIYKKAGEVELPLYVYKPAGHKDDAATPAIVFFFGGGWKSGNPSQFERQCKHLASRGMVAITVEYRVSSRHSVKVEDCIEDAKSAMRWVRAHAQDLGVDPDRIASGGGSAGGHLAACTAVIDDFDAASDNLEVSPKPNAMVLFNPAMGHNAGSESEKRTHGPIEKAAPFTYASKKQPPCIMFFGTEDRLLEGAKLYRKISEKAENQCRIVTYEGQGHGFFNRGKYYDLTLTEMDAFLVDLGWIPSK
jgi:acetyl esterase/lipase